jgi:hypothetical protein
MLVGTPLVKAEQDRAIRVEGLPEVVMGGTRLWLAKERLVPFEAASHIAYPNDRPGALHFGVLLRPNKVILSFSDIMPDWKLCERLLAGKGLSHSLETPICLQANSNVKREMRAHRT